MKKLTILCLALSIVSTGWGETASFRVAADDVKSSYEYSDIITIELVADFPVGQLGIDYIYGEPTASDPVLHEDFVVYPLNPGDVINSGGILIQAVAGSTLYDMPAGDILWQFEYHIPDVPESTTLSISAGGVIICNRLFTELTESITPLDLHVVPEPVTVALLGVGGLLIRRRSWKLSQ